LGAPQKFFRLDALEFVPPICNLLPPPLRHAKCSVFHLDLANLMSFVTIAHTTAAAAAAHDDSRAKKLKMNTA
jgi:hypothetical protein